MRVRLRPPVPGDAEPIWRAMQDPQTIDCLPFLPRPYLREDATAFVLDGVGPDDLAIEVDGDFAGMIRGGADLGYWLVPEYRGRGIMRRAAQIALLRHFAGTALPVQASHLNDNHASRRVLSALGFRDIGSTGIRRRGDNALLPARAMRLSAGDFRAALSIRSPRCEITPMAEHDFPEQHRIATRPEVARMLLRFAPGQSLDQVAAALRPAMDPLHRPVRLAIRHRGGCIGSIGVAEGEAPSIFYFLAPETVGQGLASEIVPLFCDTVQDWYGLDRLSAEVFADNPASCRVLEKAGFRITSDAMLPSAGREAPAPGWLMRRG
ncbi:MAG: GNAT family N-acetyltransferase [Paracoccus sp. (in: a-proteobacteria)]